MSDIESMDKVAISAKVSELRKDIFNKKLEKYTTGLEKPHLIKQSKKDIARLLTVLNKKNKLS